MQWALFIFFHFNISLKCFRNTLRKLTGAKLVDIKIISCELTISFGLSGEEGEVPLKLGAN